MIPGWIIVTFALFFAVLLCLAGLWISTHSWQDEPAFPGLDYPPDEPTPTPGVDT